MRVVCVFEIWQACCREDFSRIDPRSLGLDEQQLSTVQGVMWAAYPWLVPALAAASAAGRHANVLGLDAFLDLLAGCDVLDDGPDARAAAGDFTAEEAAKKYHAAAYNYKDVVPAAAQARRRLLPKYGRARVCVWGA